MKKTALLTAALAACMSIGMMISINQRMDAETMASQKAIISMRTAISL